MRGDVMNRGGCAPRVTGFSGLGHVDVTAYILPYSTPALRVCQRCDDGAIVFGFFNAGLNDPARRPPTMKPKVHPRPVLVFLAILFSIAAGAAAQSVPNPPANPITLSLDASRVTQRLIHVSSEIPVAPGALTLLYPKWIPGEHGPTGPVVNLVDLHLSANGKELAWERDPVEMYALHVVVPPGTAMLQTQADFLFPGEGGNFSSGPGATDALA